MPLGGSSNHFIGNNKKERYDYKYTYTNFDLNEEFFVPDRLYRFWSLIVAEKFSLEKFACHLIDNLSSTQYLKASLGIYLPNLVYHYAYIISRRSFLSLRHNKHQYLPSLI